VTTFLAGFSLGMLLPFSAMFVYITASPHVLIEHYGFSSTAYALVFSSNATGILLANYLNSRLVHRLGAVPLIGLGAVTTKPRHPQTNSMAKSFNERR